jgi:hypothetical protein
MDEHCYIEDTECEIHVPLYVYDGGRGEESESEVERPVTRSRESNSFSSQTKWEELRRVDSRHRSPCGGIRCNEQVYASNESFAAAPVSLIDS